MKGARAPKDGLAAAGETLGATDIENLVEALEKDAPSVVDI